MLRRALANCCSTIVLADCPLSARRALAGIEPTVGVRIAHVVLLAFADGCLPRRRAVSVCSTGTCRAWLKAAAREGVPNVVAPAPTDGTLSICRAISVDSAGALLAGVEVALDERVSLVVGSALAHGTGPVG